MQTFSSYIQNPSPLPYAGKQSNLKYMNEIISEIIQHCETACSKSHNEAEITETDMIRKDFLIKSIVIVTNNLNDATFDFDKFAADMSISKSTLYRRLQNYTGTSPYELILNIRMRYAQLFLSDPSLQIAEIALKVGFNCPKYFSNCFKKRFGLTPKAYRKKRTLTQTDTILPNNDKLLVQKATKLIQNNISDTNYKLNHLASELGLSISSFYRKIKTITGLSPAQFIRSVKLNHARILLRHNSGNVMDIAYACGFSDAKYFSRCFRGEFGILPKEVI